MLSQGPKITFTTFHSCIKNCTFCKGAEPVFSFKCLSCYTYVFTYIESQSGKNWLPRRNEGNVYSSTLMWLDELRLAKWSHKEAQLDLKTGTRALSPSQRVLRVAHRALCSLAAAAMPAFIRCLHLDQGLRNSLSHIVATYSCSTYIGTAATLDNNSGVSFVGYIIRSSIKYSWSNSMTDKAVGISELPDKWCLIYSQLQCV